MTASLLRQLHRIWLNLQVELHGKYSCERLAQLQAYERHHGWRYVAFICLLAPLPCLFLISLLDCIPLRPPSEGVYANSFFWLRNVLAVIIITYTVLEQFKSCLPHLPMPFKGQLITTLIVTAVAVGEQFLVALQVGFPVPFSLIVAATGWATAVLICCFSMWKHALRANKALWQELLNYVIVFSCQVSLPFLYPAYVYVFNSLSSSRQTAFVLMLPVIKIGTKNWISRFLKGKDDMKPQVVILNVEIFNSLYVALCMQNSTSKITTVVLMVVDLVQAWMGLKDMDEQVVSVQKLLIKIQIHAPAAMGPPLTMVDVAALIIQHDDDVPAVPEPVPVAATSTAHNHAWSARGPSPFSLNAVVPLDTSTSQKTIQNVIQKSFQKNKKSSSVSSAAASPPEDPVAQIFKCLTRQERQEFVAKTLQILFISEFVVLVEFTEVVIPVIYCVYISVMYQLPNRHFYPQMKNLTSERLTEMVGNVLMYSALELLSLIAMALILQYRLKLSSLHQLAFVLDKQVVFVQSQIILWTLYVVQSSLEHFGADFSMKFAWLQTNTNA